MSVWILDNEKHRKAVLRGVNSLADAVKATLGPTGESVVIDKEIGSPIITRPDGTITKGIDFKNPFESMGARMVSEVASKTSGATGDGITTATVLAQAIFREGTQKIAAGSNP